MFLVTGGAGFIGSNIAAALADRGDQVAVCDWLGQDDKWRNIAKHEIYDIVLPEQIADWLTRHTGKLAGIVHMGAVSATTERDVDLIVRSNLQLSIKLWEWCASNACPLIYASSAATYGDGAAGFADEFEAAALARLNPLNPYGWSKHVFDRRVLRAIANGEPAPPKWAGLKFFNVYGPNEYHKGAMRSAIAVNYANIVAGIPMRLFRSYRSDYPDGGQMRDFVYVADCAAIALWMLDNSFPSSVYNVGSGKARTWLDLTKAMFKAAGIPEQIEFIDMPQGLSDRYQYFTEARLEKLREAGFEAPMTPLETGVESYIKGYLAKEDRWA
jgi:ADP-L-glycero-D-manno-heptose 6-epimerase